MEELTKELVKNTYELLGEYFNKLIKERYSSYEAQHFLASITGDYNESEDISIKNQVVDHLKLSLTHITNKELRKVFEDELVFMFVKNGDKSVRLLTEQTNFFQYWNFYYFMHLVNIGIKEVEYPQMDMSDNAIHFLMHYKLNNSDKYKLYFDCYKKVTNFRDKVSLLVPKHGSIKVYEQIVKQVESIEIK